MFDITNNKGFHITFANGYRASVQFGAGNHCANKYEPFKKSGEAYPPCPDAEVALFDPQGNFVRLSQYDTVQGELTPEEVASFLYLAANNPEVLRVNEAA